MEYSVGIRDLKTNISKYMRQVKAGIPITITEHGKPIGQIIPIHDQPDQKILMMIAKGHAEWGGQKLADREPVGYNTGLKQISQIIEEDRE